MPTSMLMSIHPELVHLERGEAGYTGDLEAAMGVIFGTGVHAVAANGVIGDPAKASADHGARYWDKFTAITLAEVG